MLLNVIYNGLPATDEDKIKLLNNIKLEVYFIIKNTDVLYSDLLYTYIQPFNNYKSDGLDLKLKFASLINNLSADELNIKGTKAKLVKEKILENKTESIEAFDKDTPFHYHHLNILYDEIKKTKTLQKLLEIHYLKSIHQEIHTILDHFIHKPRHFALFFKKYLANKIYRYQRGHSGNRLLSLFQEHNEFRIKGHKYTLDDLEPDYKLIEELEKRTQTQTQGQPAQPAPQKKHTEPKRKEQAQQQKHTKRDTGPRPRTQTQARSKTRFSFLPGFFQRTKNKKKTKSKREVKQQQQQPPPQGTTPGLGGEKSVIYSTLRTDATGQSDTGQLTTVNPTTVNPTTGQSDTGKSGHPDPQVVYAEVDVGTNGPSNNQPATAFGTDTDI